MGKTIADYGWLAALCGFDGSGWIEALIDAAGHLQVDVVSGGGTPGGATAANQTTMITALQLIDDLRNALDSVGSDELNVILTSQDVDIEVKQTTPTDLAVAQHQYDGAAWRKSNLLYGYHDTVYEYLYETRSGAGTAEVEGTPVPAGEVWVIQMISGFHNDPTSRATNLYVQSGEDLLLIYFNNSWPSTSPVIYQGALTLKEGDFVAVSVVSLADGKTATMCYWGYKMDIAM